MAIRALINKNKHLESIDRAIVNSQNVSKYDELISLTKEVDNMKRYGWTMELKRNVIEEKYKVLNDLKEEMTALNEKLKGQEANENIEAINHQQEEEIQLLTQRLGEMDQKIAGFDGILADKDKQIEQLKDDLDKAQDRNTNKDDIIKQQAEQLAKAPEQSQAQSVKIRCLRGRGTSAGDCASQ